MADTLVHDIAEPVPAEAPSYFVAPIVIEPGSALDTSHSADAPLLFVVLLSCCFISFGATHGGYLRAARNGAYAGWAGSLPADVVDQRLEQSLRSSDLSPQSRGTPHAQREIPMTVVPKNKPARISFFNARA